MEDATERLHRLGREFTGVEPSKSYGTPSLKLRGKFLARLKDEHTLVVRCPLEQKAFLIKAEPAIFFETDHYRGYDALLVRLAAADDATIRARLREACETARRKRR